MGKTEYTSQRKVFAFDLSIEKLKEYYSENNPKKAYRDIALFFYKNGFEHDQYSGYVSKECLTNAQALLIARKLKEEFNWINKVATSFRISDANEALFDIMKYYDSMDEILHKKVVNKQNNRDKNHILR